MSKLPSHFKPAVSDLYIGYFCDLQINAGGIWEPVTISKENFADCVKLLSEGQLRTSYLTPDQITNSGGMPYEANDCVWTFNTDSPCTYRLIFQVHGEHFQSGFDTTVINPLIMVIKDNPNHSHSPLYHGYCPSFNELRTIFRFIGIIHHPVIKPQFVI